MFCWALFIYKTKFAVHIIMLYEMPTGKVMLAANVSISNGYFQFDKCIIYTGNISLCTFKSLNYDDTRWCFIFSFWECKEKKIGMILNILTTFGGWQLSKWQELITYMLLFSVFLVVSLCTVCRQQFRVLIIHLIKLYRENIRKRIFFQNEWIVYFLVWSHTLTFSIQLRYELSILKNVDQDSL